MTIINERLLRMMDPQDRKQFGRAGMTMPEHSAEDSEKAERKLHSDYVSFLRRHGFKDHQILTSPMNRKSFLPPGFPDFLIEHGGKHLYIEFKVGNNVLSPIQEIVIADKIASGCTVLVIYSYSEAINETMKYFNL